MAKTKTEIDKKRLEKLLGSYTGDMTDSEKLPEYRERKPHGYWQKWKNIKSELNGVITRLGHFPTQKELVRDGYHGMIDAIGDYFGGLNKVRKKLGYEAKIVKSGVWKDLAYTIKQARKAMKKSGSNRLPSQKELCCMGYSSLTVSIANYHGGFTKFRKILGERNTSEDYNNQCFVLKEAKKVIKKHGYDTLPCANKLKELGYVTLAVAIDKKHGGYRKFREL